MTKHEPSLFAEESPSLRTITEEALARYFDLDERRKKLQREADKLEREEKLLRVEIETGLTAAGRSDVRRGQFEAEIRDGAVYPKWKDEFIKALGAEAAVAVEKRTPKSKQFTVRKLASHG